MTKRLAEQVGQAAADEYGMTVTALRLAWPTPDEAWPDWALPSFPEPAHIRRQDGSPLPALAASDLARAVMAALERDESGFEVFHIHGDASGEWWDLGKARDGLGWLPLRR